MTFGKVMGGGLPGRGLRRPRRRDVAALAPRGPSTRPARCPGTPWPPPPGLATLRLATDEVYAHLTAVGDTIKAAVVEAFDAAGLAHVVQSAGTMFSVFLLDPAELEGGRVRDFDDASRTDSAAYAALFHAMLDAGVYLPPSAYEAWFVSAAHDDRAVQTVLDALPGAARAAAAAQQPPRR